MLKPSGRIMNEAEFVQFVGILGGREGGKEGRKDGRTGPHETEEKTCPGGHDSPVDH